MTASDSFDDLMGRLRRGEADAAAQLFDRYARRLIGLAGRHLDERLRRKIDAEDVVQSVLKSFFGRQRRGQFDLSDWDGLWALLVRITLHKCGHQVEYYGAACRALARERPPLGGDDSVRAFTALAAEPSPAEAAALADLTEHFLAALEGERERQVFALTLEGHTAAEISARLGRTERTVRRTLARVRSRLQRLYGKPFS